MKTRYTYKYPRTPWDSLRGRVMRNQRLWWYSAERAAEWISHEMRAGYTSEPYMQLVEIDADGMRVVAECAQGPKWLDPLVAAGFKPRPVR